MARQLIEAIRNGDPSLARNILLSDKYGCIDCQTAKRDGTALFWACAKGFLELVQLLIAKGANVNARTNYNSTPLIAAADSNRHHVVRLLIENGADLNAQTSNGDTACHQAAYRGHLEAVRLLVSHGADVDITNTKFRTPYDEAARQGHLNLLPFLDGSEKLAGPKSSKISRSTSLQVHHHSHNHPHQHSVVVPGCGLKRVEPCEPPRRDSYDCLSHESLSRESSYEDCGQVAVLINAYDQDLDDGLLDRELVFGPDPERFFPPPPPPLCHPSTSSLLLPPLPSSSSISIPTTSATGLPLPSGSMDLAFSVGGNCSFSSSLPFTYSDVETNNLSLASDRTSSSKRNLIARLNIPT